MTKGMTGVGPPRRRSTRSQSQIGQGRHLARRRTAQVMAAVGLSVGVRMRPLVSLVNGTVVARPARMTFVRPGSVGTDSTAG
jgi:hypothetical protein